MNTRVGYKRFINLLKITSGPNQLSIDPDYGGRAVSWKISGVEVLAPAGENPIVGGWYLMAPWVGRLENNQISFNGNTYLQKTNFQHWAIHGTFPFQSCEIISIAEDSIALRQSSTSDWLEAADIDCVWKVTNKGVQTQATVTTQGRSFPASIGWHPWFRRKLEAGEAAEYKLEAFEKFHVNHEMIIDGTTTDNFCGPFDDSFYVPSGKASIAWPGFYAIDIESSAKYIHLYEARNSVCIEPETAPPNGVNLLELELAQLVTFDNPLHISVNWNIRKLG